MITKNFDVDIDISVNDFVEMFNDFCESHQRKILEKIGNLKNVSPFVPSGAADLHQLKMSLTAEQKDFLKKLLED